MKKLSGRLQNIIDYLRQRGGVGATTLEIYQNCSTMNPATRISELRKKGYRLESRDMGRNHEGAQVWRYILLEDSAPVPPQAHPPLPLQEMPPTEQELWKPGEKRGF